MKKFKMISIAAASLIGLGAAFGFTSPITGCGWKNLGNGWVQYTPGTDTGEYTCDDSVNVTCTFQNDHTTRCDKGTFILH
jgi:hypothetical protein